MIQTQTLLNFLLIFVDTIPQFVPKTRRETESLQSASTVALLCNPPAKRTCRCRNRSPPYGLVHRDMITPFSLCYLFFWNGCYSSDDEVFELNLMFLLQPQEMKYEKH